MPKTQIDRRRRRGKPAPKPPPSPHEKVTMTFTSDEDGSSPEMNSDESRGGADEEKNIHSSSEDNEEENSEEPDNPDDEDFEAPASSSDDDDDDLSQDYVPAKKRVAPRSSRSSRAARRSYRDSSSSDEENYSRRPTRSRGRQQKNYREGVSDGEEEEEEEFSPRRSTPSRASAKRASEKLHEMDESEEDETKMPLLTPKKKKKVDSDSDEFVASKEDDDDDYLSVDDDGDDDLVDGNIQNVDNESFCSKDSSSSGDNFDRSPSLDIRRRRKSRPANDSDDDASLSEFQTTPVAKTTNGRQRIACPSTHDVITMDPLPDKHVCYVTPDHQSRQCFALETLHKVAMSSQIAYKDGKRTFLQPPHFRTAISDDLQDQIASRFGRAALDLDGYFFNRTREEEKHLMMNSDEFDYMVNFDGSLADSETFRERFDNYISNLMGHQDVYCCPLCYTEAYRSLMNPDESGDDDSDQDDDDEEGEAINVVFSHDPMTILGSLDSDSFLLASTFCFTRIAQVKRHLREDHNVDTSVLDGNGLFTRFKIRESDGLLQRYIDNCHFLAYQGSMSRYWHEGYNLMFLQLLHLMKRTQIMKAQVETSGRSQDNVDADDRMILDDSEVFLGSFRNRARRVWEKLSAPYRKMDKKELDDFIASDEEEASPPMFNHTQIIGRTDLTPEEQVAATLKKRRKSRGGDSSEEEEEVVSSQDEKDEDSESEYSAASENMALESDSEEDDWVQQRRPKKSKGKTDKKPGARRLGKRKGTTSSTSPASVNAISQSTTKQKRRIILSDDED